MSSQTVTVVRPVNMKLLAKVLQTVESEKRQIYREAQRISERLAALLEEMVKKGEVASGQTSYARLAATILAAVRMYLYILAEAFYSKTQQQTGSPPADKTAYVKMINEVLEIAWSLTPEILLCKECGEETPAIYI